MTLLALSQPALLGLARVAAFVAFAVLLAGLAFLLHRTRKQLRADEADAAVEVEFQKLERELGDEARPGHVHGPLT